MKGVYMPGHKIEAPCEKCGRFVTATYRYDTLPLDDGTLIPDVMLARCDDCNSILLVAQQSAHAIKAARDARDAAHRKRTTLRVSRPLYDYAANEVSKLGVIKEPVSLLLKAFLATLIDSPPRLRRISRRLHELDDPVLEQPFDVQVALYLSDSLLSLARQLRQEARLKSTSEVFRRALVAAKGDREVDSQVRKLAACG